MMGSAVMIPRNSEGYNEHQTLDTQSDFSSTTMVAWTSTISNGLISV